MKHQPKKLKRTKFTILFGTLRNREEPKLARRPVDGGKESLVVIIVVATGNTKATIFKAFLRLSNKAEKSEGLEIDRLGGESGKVLVLTRPVVQEE